MLWTQTCKTVVYLFELTFQKKDLFPHEGRVQLVHQAVVVVPFCLVLQRSKGCHERARKVHHLVSWARGSIAHENVLLNVEYTTPSPSPSPSMWKERQYDQ